MIAAQFGETVSWGEWLFGWTSALVGLLLAALGVILLARRRAGYWSAEALVGAELLLLTVQAGTWLARNSSADWRLPADGSNGGLVGWALGATLLAGFGRTLGLIFLVMTGVAALLLLLRYTPLIYLLAGAASLIGRMVPSLRGWATRLARSPADARGEPVVAHGERPAVNFVPPVARVQPLDEDELDLPDFLRKREGNSTGSATEARTQPFSKTPHPRNDKTAVAAPAAPYAAAKGTLPSIDLLSYDSGVYSGTDVSWLERRIEETMEEFNVPVKVVHVESGPTVTQFGVEPLYLERAGQLRKVRVSQITSLANDLALALAAQAVRIEAPVAGQHYVGIEVPNPEKTLVGLRAIMESAEMRKNGGTLALPLGRNTSGAPVTLDLTRAPHMLIAGATGSGKSVCINTIIMGLLMRHGPETLRLIMVDPKRVELTGYNGIPHLMGPVVTDVDKVMGALTWLLIQMDDRYRAFRAAGVRNIDAYNALARKPVKGEPALQPFPYIVLIVDELADLMMTAPEDIERTLCRLAQMARATGIHLILATQRPSVDVVTGLIKANFPTRIAFAVTSMIDSRVILDTPGAESLLGRGDMLLQRPDVGKLQRVQGCLVTDEEINAVVGFWKERAGAADQHVREPWADLMDREEEGDELVQEAIDALRGLPVCSTSMLQRKLRIGYPRAARLMEQLESKRVVGPDLGGGQGREVLLKRDSSDGESTALTA